MSTITEDEETTGTSETYEHSRVYRWLDDRLDLDDTFLGKAFPEDRYASFLLGEVTLFTFVVLVLTGTFLGLLYSPSTTDVTYKGPVAEFAGKEVPAAFASVLHITYGVRMGMFLRMMHHWGAYIFISAMALHMFRVFFTGAYRNPRELNWMVGSLLLILAILEGFLGYALPYDSYSATATGIGVELLGTTPYIGDNLVNILIGGPWPEAAQSIIPRLFFFHVFLVPLFIAGLIGVHLFLLVRQKHTEQASEREAETGVDRDDQSVVVGTPLVPNQAVVTLVVFLTVLGFLSLLAAFFPVQRLPPWGPNDPTTTPTGVAPDWYFMWVFGLLKISPQHLGGISEFITSLFGGVSFAEFMGGQVVPGLTLLGLILWPFIDYSKRQVHFTADPLDRPFPTAAGVGAITYIIFASLSAMNSHVADLLGLQDTGTLNTVLLVLNTAFPLVYFGIVYWLLRRRKRRLGRTDRSQTTTGSTASEAD